jgi:hypothetical protein
MVGTVRGYNPVVRMNGTVLIMHKGTDNLAVIEDGTLLQSVKIKFYDCFGTEIFKGDKVVTARPSRKLRIITLDVLCVEPVESWYVAKWESPEYTGEVYDYDGGGFTINPTPCARKTVHYKYTEVKTYKRLNYITKHGVKFNRIMKLQTEWYDYVPYC